MSAETDDKKYLRADYEALMALLEDFFKATTPSAVDVVEIAKARMKVRALHAAGLADVEAGAGAFDDYRKTIGVGTS